MKRVLCAVDLSDMSVEVVHDAQATVQRYGEEQHADVIVVGNHVGSTNTSGPRIDR